MIPTVVLRAIGAVYPRLAWESIVTHNRPGDGPEPRESAMRSLQLTILLATLLISGVAVASAAGPFPQFGVLDAACGVGNVVPGGGPLRITYQNVAQSCAVQRCSVIHDAPLDAGEVRVEWTATPGDGKTTPLEGRFVKTGETCGARPVWLFEGAIPAAGAIVLIGPGTSYGTIQIQVKEPAAQAPSE